jgi:branched-chain amino acid transport system permease protein
MVTLVLTQVVTLTALALPITNGAKGISSIPLPSSFSIAGFALIPDFSSLENTKLAFYYTACIIMILTYAALYRLVNSRLGHLCRSMQQNEELASSIGVNIAYIRILIFAISSFFGGIGGAMFGAITQSVYPSSFQVVDSVNFMLNCFLGGLGYVFGPMLGTLVLYFGWDLMFELGRYQLLTYSLLLIVLIRFLPNGLLSISFHKRSKS